MHKVIFNPRIAITAFVIVSFYFFGSINELWKRELDVWLIIYCLKTTIEVIASLYAFFYFFVSVYYRKPKNAAYACKNKEFFDEQTAVIYLCCDDFDPEALESIVNCCDDKLLNIMVHDDSFTLTNRDKVNKTVELLCLRYKKEIKIMRRKEREGGKPGALNYVVDNLTKDIKFIVICDSDSYFYDPSFFHKTLAYFKDASTALVQFRNIGHIDSGDPERYRILSESINFYDAFTYFLDKVGWSPFLGHNSMLRVSAIKEVGYFTPGQFADDIDFSIKLRLNGYGIKYARNIVCGERHPITYEALRLRTHKWAYGCTQILLSWSKNVISSTKLGIREKITFFLTISYYHSQLCLLLYLTIFYLILPFYDPDMGGVVNLFVSSGLILLLTFLPSITYFIYNRKSKVWFSTICLWGFTYGSQDFVIASSIFSGLSGKTKIWVPTNQKPKTHRVPTYYCESAFGSLIVAVALTNNPWLLLLPTTILFAGKFFFASWSNNLAFENHDLTLMEANKKSSFVRVFQSLCSLKSRR